MININSIHINFDIFTFQKKKNINIFIIVINILMNDHHYERSFGFLAVTFGLLIISL